MSKGMEGGVSRRSFLKGAGVAAAAVAGSAALAGCASGSTGAASGDWLPKSWDYECDLLVIGYGGAGMWASLIGADECGQEVIVLEKAPVEGGGNSRINNGEWTIVEESDKERFKKYIKAFTHGKTPEPMIDAWVNECVRNTEYADKYGMTYEVSEVAPSGATSYSHSRNSCSTHGHFTGSITMAFRPCSHRTPSSRLPGPFLAGQHRRP